MDVRQRNWGEKKYLQVQNTNAPCDLNRDFFDVISQHICTQFWCVQTISNRHWFYVAVKVPWRGSFPEMSVYLYRHVVLFCIKINTDASYIYMQSQGQANNCWRLGPFKRKHLWWQNDCLVDISVTGYFLEGRSAASKECLQAPQPALSQSPFPQSPFSHFSPLRSLVPGYSSVCWTKHKFLRNNKYFSACNIKGGDPYRNPPLFLQVSLKMFQIC